MILLTNRPDFEMDLKDIIKLFYPEGLNEQWKIEVNNEFNGNCLVTTVSLNIDNQEFYEVYSNQLDEFLNEKKLTKNSLYLSLSKFTGKQMEWGSLTGIRPTKLAYDLMRKGVKLIQIPRVLNEKFFVSKEKIDLVMSIIENQKPIERNDNLVDLYINIPFCTTRCSYCTFISAEISKCKDLLVPYVDALLKELEETKKIILENALIVKNIYIGGGTPTSLTIELLEDILKNIGYSVKEFTVEAGRPDTINAEKLDLLKKYGVTRISINPQSFNDKVLSSIGRSHTAKDVIEKYNLARNYGFDINMDFIAGLKNETLKSFKENMFIALHLNPENITIHTLSYKRASVLTQNEGIKANKLVKKMIDFSKDFLTKNGFKPYYMYRQKNQLESLENVGYFRDNKICRFNIESMEETTSVLAVGANAISKRVYVLENRIEREANVKDIKEYITRIDEMIERKKKLFKK